jgi:hypothetical protein
MNKTQLLSDTENLFITREKSQNIKKQVTWYSNDGTLVFRKWKTAVTTVTMVFSPCFIFVDNFTINTLQLHKHIKDYLI